MVASSAWLAVRTAGTIYMYPWVVVFRSLGWFAFAEIGFFLTILGLGILYAWREGALEWS
ncbi:MAG: NADH-quinone oxidoreductase subunit A [Solirubrobacteraceae bacterium]